MVNAQTAELRRHSQTQPSLEAVDAVNVLSNTFSAEYAESTMFESLQARRIQLSRLRFLQQQQLRSGRMTLQDLIGKSEFAPTPFQSKYQTLTSTLTMQAGHLAGQSRA